MEIELQNCQYGFQELKTEVFKIYKLLLSVLHVGRAMLMAM